MKLYSEIDLDEQLNGLQLTPKQKSGVRGLISTITEEYSDQIEKMKRCDNCKHLGIFYDEVLGTIASCVYQVECHDYGKWRLAE